MNALSFRTSLVVCIAGALVGCREGPDSSHGQTAEPTRPSVSEIANQTTYEDLSKRIAFTVGNGGAPLSQLRLSALSSNPELVSANNITFEGVGAEREALIQPTLHWFGHTTITIKVSNSSAETNRSFRLDVSPVGGVPQISSEVLERLRLKSSEPVGAANQSQPVASETNRTQGTAGPGR